MAKRTEKFSEQISVIVVPEARRYLEKEAEYNCRSLAAQIRFMLEEAARRAGAMNGSQPWPPPLIPNGESLDTTRCRLQSLIEERAALEARDRRVPGGLLPQQEERLRYVRDTIKSLEVHIDSSEKMERAS